MLVLPDVLEEWARNLLNNLLMIQELIFLVVLKKEQVVSFETDYPEDFLDLVEEMRSQKARAYTERDVPIITCIHKKINEIIKILS